LNRLLYTTGQGHFEEIIYDYPVSKSKHIIVKNIMTGVCRSDIDMMTGKFSPLPFCMQGHEGLGQVIDVGNNLFTSVKVGDIVATRGEPAYADFYSVREEEFVIVPEAHPRYIIEPVACGINIILSNINELFGRAMLGNKILLLGTGFLSFVAYHMMYDWEKDFTNCRIDVVGSSNKDIWNNIGVEITTQINTHYDIIVDLNGTIPLFLQKDIINENGLLVEGVSRDISKIENELLLWKSITTVRPSPRNQGFHGYMEMAVSMIQNGKLNVDNFWTKSYNRETEWHQAFSDGLDRPKNYSRGYIVW
jgi:threonine dehydrogenase-like Zn-dependent dehydrogenase